MPRINMSKLDMLHEGIQRTKCIAPWSSTDATMALACTMRAAFGSFKVGKHLSACGRKLPYFALTFAPTRSTRARQYQGEAATSNTILTRQASLAEPLRNLERSEPSI